MHSTFRSSRAAPRDGARPRPILLATFPTGIPFRARLRVATMQATPATITALALVLLALAVFRVGTALCRHARAQFRPEPRRVPRRKGRS